MTQNYQIGNEFGVTFRERIEWRLSQMQAALAAGGGSSPAVEALLTDLLGVMQVIQAQTDGIELTSENISLNADEISLNTDQVEALLTTIDGHIVALQAQVGNTAGIEARLIEVRDQLIAVAGSTDGIEAGIAGLDTKSIAANLSLSVIEAQLGGFQPLIDGLEGLLTSLLTSSTAIETQLANIESVSGDTNTLLATQGADVALIRTATANLLAVVTALESGTATDLTAIQTVLADELIKLNQIYGTATNSEALLTTIEATIEGSNTKLDTLITQTDGLETTLANQLAVTTAGNAKLDALVAQTDGIEGGLTTIDATIEAGNLITADVRAAAQALQVQTDQVEPLLTAINGQIAALQNQVGDTSTLEARLIEVRDELIEQNSGLSLLNQEINSSTGNGGVFSSLINGQLAAIKSLNEQIYDQLKPLLFWSSNIYDSSSVALGSPLPLLADPLCRKRSILNDTGESGGSGNTPLAGQAWIFGSYRNNSVSEDDFDFVVDPGDIHVCDLPDSDMWLVCIAPSGGGGSGRFLVMEYH